MKVAIVVDWLTTMGGAEQVIINIKRCFKEAPIYTTIYAEDKMDDELKNIEIHTSRLQKKASKKKNMNHRKYFPWMPMIFEEFDLNDYDLVISSSSSCAKGILTKPGSTHICYCHTPMRYAWDKRNEYLEGMGRLKKKFVEILLHYMRIWDVNSSNRVDYFIANSNEVKNRIEKYYKRDAVVIHPPVRCDMFNISDTDGDYYLVLSRLVKYKRFDLAVKACKELNKKLVVIGEGPELENLKKDAEGNKNIVFLGRQSDEVVKKYMAECRALLFPGEEDFGIVPVEAQSSGRPVIAYGKGGVLDSVIDGKTGVFFERQTVEDVKNAISKFETMTFDKEEIRKHALKFDEKEFRRKILEFVKEKVELK